LLSCTEVVEDSRAVCVLQTAPVKFEAFQSPSSSDGSCGGSGLGNAELISGSSYTLGRSVGNVASRPQQSAQSNTMRRH